MEREPIYLKKGNQLIPVNLDDDELSLQICLGNMDYQDKLLDEDESQNLRDLVLMKHRNFFAGADEYLNLFRVDGALRRFRQSRLGKPTAPRKVAPVASFSSFYSEKIVDFKFHKKEFLKIIEKIS